MHDIWKALLSEFLGTFTLVFIGGSAASLTVQQGGNLLLTAFAFGFAMISVFYTYSSFSGSHVNPAVSFGFAVSGRMGWCDMLLYWAAQLLGAIAAAALVWWFFGARLPSTSGGNIAAAQAWKTILVEALLTFFLVMTFLFSTSTPLTAIAAGLAIGLVYTSNVLAAGPLTGDLINPATSIGTGIFNGNIGSWWIYILGPLIGALVAGLVYRAFQTCWGSLYSERCPSTMTVECEVPCNQACPPVIEAVGIEAVHCPHPIGQDRSAIVVVKQPAPSCLLPSPQVGFFEQVPVCPPPSVPPTCPPASSLAACPPTNSGPSTVIFSEKTVNNLNVDYTDKAKSSNARGTYPILSRLAPLSAS